MPRRIIVLALLAAFSALQTGCCGRIRQCIANKWNARHGYGDSCGACCTPAFKVPGPAKAFHGGWAAPMAGCATCNTPIEGVPVVYGNPPTGTPTITGPMPLHNPTVVPDTMTPPKGSGQ